MAPPVDAVATSTLILKLKAENHPPPPSVPAPVPPAYVAPAAHAVHAGAAQAAIAPNSARR